MSDSRAIVLFSGGQDSTVALAWALDRFDAVETVGFDYGQRHRVELDCRTVIRNRLPALSPTYAARLGADHLIDLAALGAISETALTRDNEIAFAETGLPTTFVPGRNLIFLTFAAALAYRRARPIIRAIPTAATTPSRRCRSHSAWASTAGSCCTRR